MLCLHSARSCDAQQLLVVIQQQDLKLCAIIRMSADVVDGIMCCELFCEGILDTDGWLEQLIPGGLIGCLQKHIGLHIRYRPERNQRVTSSKIVRYGKELCSEQCSYIP